MPIYMVTFDSCGCTPIPDMAIRAENMVSAVMQAQEKLDMILRKAEDADVDIHEHNDITIQSIGEVDFELMDDAGIESVVECWKDTVKR